MGLLVAAMVHYYGVRQIPPPPGIIMETRVDAPEPPDPNDTDTSMATLYAMGIASRK